MIKRNDGYENQRIFERKERNAQTKIMTTGRAQSPIIFFNVFTIGDFLNLICGKDVIHVDKGLVPAALLPYHPLFARSLKDRLRAEQALPLNH